LTIADSIGERKRHRQGTPFAVEDIPSRGQPFDPRSLSVQRTFFPKRMMDELNTDKPRKNDGYPEKNQEEYDVLTMV
jgi:hypothetical protein